MAWVRFTAKHSFTPPEDRRSSVVYQPGWAGCVRAECAAQAIGLGRAVALPTPDSDDAPAKPAKARRARKPKIQP